MKALLLTAPGRLEIADVPAPDVGPRDVLVRVAVCGICGSDVHGYHGSSGRRIPPLVMGHEAAGTIDRVGAEVTRFRPGARVTFDSMISNPASWFSQRGMANLCDERRILGVSCADYRRQGAFAELVAVPEHIVYAIPDGLGYEQAALAEPVSVAVHAVRRSGMEAGDSVLVVGAGMIGQLCVQAARAAEAGKVLVCDVDAARFEQAARSADRGLDSRRDDVVGEARAATEGRGVDVAFEAVGATAPIATAIEATRKGGTVVLVGNVSPQVEVPLQSIVTREITLVGTCGCNGEYPQCLELLTQGAINVDSLISVVAPLEEGPEWFARLKNREPGLTKVLLRP